MRARIRRWILRLLYCAVSLCLMQYLGGLAADGDTPTLYEGMSLPLLRAVTPEVYAARPSAPSPASASVAEPTEPIPEPEPAEPGDILALMYHDLTTDESLTSEWRTTPEGLREDLLELLSLGYRPLSIEDYVADRYEIGPDYFIVTFDDGYSSNAELAEPILQEMGVPATMFVVTASTDMEHHLSWGELAEMQARGVISVYTHTHTHADGLQMSTKEFLANVEQSWQEILDHLQEPEFPILSYPNGSYTWETMSALAEDGYRLFVIQSRPWWFEAESESKADENGIRILVRMNVAHGADIRPLVDLNRERLKLETLADKQEAQRRAAEAALAAERAERLAWMTQYGGAR